MAELSNIIDYFKACYQEDFKAIKILNFLDKKVEHQLVFKDAEILSGNLMQYPVSTVWAKQVEQYLVLNSSEKSLYCCAFFLSGKMNIIGRTKKIFAPLYIYPVQLFQEDEVYYIKINVEKAVINPIFVDFIKTHAASVNFSYDDLASALPKSYIRFDEIHQIEETLKRLIPELDISALDDFPNMYNEEQVKKTYNKRNTKKALTLLPCIAFGIIQKATGSRGILNELEEMAHLKSTDLSGILQELFGLRTPTINKAKSRKIFTPVSLSKNQENIFHSLDDHDITMVIGPPGTGKSFTIAAIATDFISHGKSVLIASKNSQAGEVIHHKIEKEFGLKGVTIKSSSASFKNQLQKRLYNIYQGIEVQKVYDDDLNKMEANIRSFQSRIEEKEKEIIEQEKQELKWGKFYAQYKDGFFDKIKKYFIDIKVESKNPLWTMKAALNKMIDIYQYKVKRFIKKEYQYHLYDTLRYDRKEIQYLVNGLQTSTGNLTKEYFDKANFEVVLHALPAWIVNAGNVNEVLPLQKELFDIVIIDEATQCDIASSLPLLQRAKKALIVGDPKQLRHISFLSKANQRNLIKEYKLDNLENYLLNYRENSILDLFSAAIPSQNQVHFLNEHFRSMPDIIQFSNEHFYANQLSVMTANPLTINEKSVFLHTIEEGTRNEKGANEAEALAIIEQVKKIIEKEADLNKNMRQTIGILSPFRAQVLQIKNTIRKHIDTKSLNKHSILIGTPFDFQGEERDIMFLSFAVDKNTHPSTYIYLNRADIFNVSITRARSLQHIFTSIDSSNLPAHYLLTQYIDQITHTISDDSQNPHQLESDLFLEQVVESLKKWKIKEIYTGYQIAGLEIDIVLIHEGKTMCIDLVGYPGDYERIFPIERWKMLSRVGVKTFTLPFSAWYCFPEKCKRYLKKFIFG